MTTDETSITYQNLSINLEKNINMAALRSDLIVGEIKILTCDPF
jgi:hypothetical protein